VLAAACLVGVALRIWLARRAPHSTDLDAYGEVLALVRSGRPVYEGTAHFNYPPLWFWTLGALGRLAETLGIPFALAVRSLLILVDVTIGAVLYRLAGRLGTVRPIAAAAFFLANPMTIWIGAAQAQFDGVMVLFVLLALLADSRKAASPREAPRWRSMLSLAAAIGFKQAAAFHPILWFRGPHRWRALVPWALVAAAFLPYAAQARAIRDHVLLYRTVPRSFGFSEFVTYDDRWALPVSLLAVLAAVLAAWLLRERERCRSSLMIFLVLLVFAPGFGIQYLVWPLALGALFGGAGFWLTTAAGLLWTDVGGGWSRLSGVNQFGGQLLWLALVFWTLQELERLRRPRLVRAP